MKLARLDRRVTLQRVTTTRTALGGQSETWANLATVWAEIRNLKGREAVEALQKSPEAQALITIRYSSQVADLSAADRIKVGSILYDIVAPPIEIPAGRPEKIEILCKSAA